MDRVSDLRLLGGLGLVVGLLLTACTASADQQAITTTPEQEDQPDAVSEMLDPCAKPNLTTVEPGALTFTTSIVPDPPFFLTDKPSDREGFDSEFAYELAARLGFRPGEVTWEIVPADLVLSGEFVGYDVAIGGYVPESIETTSVDFSQSYLDRGLSSETNAPDDAFALALVAGNPLLACVDRALSELSDEGTLVGLRERWLTSIRSSQD